MNRHPSGLPPSDPLMSPAPLQATNRSDPGETLGIISIFLDVIGFSLIGIVLGVISRNKSRAAGFDGVTGKIGLILGIVFTILTTAALAAFTALLVTVYNQNVNDLNFPIEQIEQQT
jgi:hypothetical protein